MLWRIPDYCNILALNTSNKEALRAFSKIGKSEQDVTIIEKSVALHSRVWGERHLWCPLSPVSFTGHC